MPFRFRKIIPIGKGFRINLSKSGLSSSIGGKGFTLNLGKRGVRPTISMPGTGLAYTPSMSSAPSAAINQKSSGLTKNCLTGLISILLICIITTCCLGVIFSDTSLLSTPTPFINVPIETRIAETYSAARFQTLSVASPIPPPFTFTPVQLPPTVIYPVTVYPATLAPTWTPIPTSTQFILNTLPAPSLTAACSCSGDLYNCADFQTHASAQACFDYCVSQGRGDIHKLDGNNDGLACESLP